ncbi:MAG TPA: GIY-YIG nuclease family protein, partial [Candidatus Peregrinibacteria bacterium]|nr:GIY-YIG nuclease family protein [Candidatus Peregrinibacteria bacterium]
MFTVYILYNPQQRTYVGFSDNFKERLKEHNNIHGKKRGWTRLKGPWRLLHKEEFKNKTEALKREKELKTGKGRDFIK